VRARGGGAPIRPWSAVGIDLASYAVAMFARLTTWLGALRIESKAAVFTQHAVLIAVIAVAAVPTIFRGGQVIGSLLSSAASELGAAGESAASEETEEAEQAAAPADPKAAKKAAKEAAAAKKAAEKAAKKAAKKAAQAEKKAKQKAAKAAKKAA
jgi:hypothetical protein